MPATPDDLVLETIIVNELKEGVAAIKRDGLGDVATWSYRHPRTDSMLFEIGGRFAACPDRDVSATVEIDPRRVGWRLEATLWDYPDSEDHYREIRGLGAATVEELSHAEAWARIYATAAWAAVRDYLRGDCSGMSR